MIVKCESCQSRFRIGDDKVTERGVKVRCTKCGAVFTVRRGAPPPAPEPDPEPEPEPEPDPEPEPEPEPDPEPPLAAKSSTRPTRPPAPPPDAFAADPAPLVENIFGQAANEDPPPPSPIDPTFTPAFGSEQSGAGEGPHTAYGDLPTEWPPPDLARPDPAPSPAAARTSDPLDMALDPLGKTPAPSRIEEYWSNASPPSNSVLPDLDGAEDDPLAGLNLSRSLEDHDEVHSNGAAPAALAATDPEDRTSGQSFGEFSQFQQDDSSEPLANQVGWEPPPEGEAAPAPDEPAVKWTEPAEPEPPPVVEPPLKVQQVEEEPAEERSIFDSIIRTVAGTSFLILAVLGFVIYRNGGSIDLRHMGPYVSGALGLSKLPALREQYAAAVEASGYYPTLNGSSLVFVTGRATNGGAKPIPLAVHLEIDDGAGRILGRADALPGVLATPEDLYAVRGPSDLDALQHRLSSSAPPTLQPGQSLPFTLVLANPNVPLDGALLRVSAAPWTTPAGPQPAPAPPPANP